MSESVESRARIRARISPGMFAHERGVRIDLPDGESLSMFVDRSQVEVDREPQPGEEISGLLEVAVVSADDGRAIIDLPQQTFTTGTRIEVPRSFLRDLA
jgi:hypothetical protein